ncbi:hypothetical protein KCH_68500 [Kitasatospora cheerisanensis KCTC 2395]|uniref:Uncharacterized protein n=1 Tax=Kitasatospora cheerisanensis KCTC 2395 TaxID=1348663 RepID=A0A066YIT9_9ACTN|nr:hypothetical protein [Kitasatospora cheerisanensis]KDN81403.1 hypothetical protein KCH_68500 [Kitasatospora cheerisanensis KCTC 2395]
MSPELSRRTLLGGAAAAAVLSALPLSVRQALAAPPAGQAGGHPARGDLHAGEPGVRPLLRHLPGVRGFGDARRGGGGVNGRSVFHQPTRPGPRATCCRTR